MSHILHVVGARPNFMKVAPVMEALGRRSNIYQTLVHTGQHYDTNMSDIFFEQLGLPRPDISLGVGSGSHGAQTGRIMISFEESVQELKPDLVLVYGDVNSTVAAAMVCAKLGIRVAHVEAGLRSLDRSMPEEINRIVTDQLADILFTPSSDGDDNLLCEGIPSDRIQEVGNVMIDTLVRLLPKAKLPEIPDRADKYALVTLHRPSNVDDPQALKKILDTLNDISQNLQLVFPIHPRTRKKIEQMGENRFDSEKVRLLEPVGYLEFLALQKEATAVITDSGGIQEETTYLGVPCLTLRKNTERPITVSMGTNTLIGDDMKLLQDIVDDILAGEQKPYQVPPLWDGYAGERIAEFLTTGQINFSDGNQEDQMVA